MSLERWPYRDVEPVRHEHEIFSLAVSAKRIADALDGIRTSLDTLASIPERRSNHEGKTNA